MQEWMFYCVILKKNKSSVVSLFKKCLISNNSTGGIKFSDVSVKILSTSSVHDP